MSSTNDDAQHLLPRENGWAWPSVSVVVPTRDRPDLLRRAVKSIVRQRYPGDIECIIVFDQSAPSTVDVQSLERRDLRALTNVRTPGLAGARNTGAMAAEGEFLAFCDDDDEWLPDKLRLQVEALLANGSRAAATCGLYIQYGGRSIRRLPPVGEVTLADLRRSRVMEVHSSTIVVSRSEFLGRIGPVDEEIPGGYGEDYDWLLRTARIGPLVVVPRPLVRIRWHRSSWFEGRWQMIVAALEYLLRKHPDLRDDPVGSARISGQIAFAHAASGNSAQARRWAIRAIRSNWRERRSYVALAVSLGLISADFVLQLAHARGRGI
jgi:glycosyltransferase involved in cell wall biosynthesis